MIIHNKFMKWKHDLGNEYQHALMDFAKAHEYIYSATNVPKIRSFQYRVLQRGLVTNVHLYNWNMRETPLCSFCGEQEESIVHMLCLCPRAKRLWDDVASYIRDRFEGILVELTPTTIIFNQVVSERHVVNFICLVTKQFIYRQRCLKQDLHFPILKGYLGQIENIEKYIATKNSNLTKHNRKWCPDGQLDAQQGTNAIQSVYTY